MTDRQLGDLFGAFAEYYWSVPVSYAREKIAEWHPEVTPQQIERVLKQCAKDVFRYHCGVEKEGLEEAELAAEHLFAGEPDDYERFIAVRADLPICGCDEETLFERKEGPPEIPEVRALRDFGRRELELDDGWTLRLADEAVFFQFDALCSGKSWVKSVLNVEQYGKMRFCTVEQLKRLRELGNRLYPVIPNPVLRGWRPADVENPPRLPDDIPEKDGDIPNGRPEMEKLYASFGGREKFNQALERNKPEYFMPGKIGRNDSCPCGSGKKYKKCCGQQGGPPSGTQNQ